MIVLLSSLSSVRLYSVFTERGTYGNIEVKREKVRCQCSKDPRFLPILPTTLVLTQCHLALSTVPCDVSGFKSGNGTNRYAVSLSRLRNKYENYSIS